MPKPAATDHVRLEIKSVFSEQERVVSVAQAFAEEHVEDEEHGYKIVLAASEAVTNAMRHGNASDAEKRVFIDFWAFADRLEVAVEDEGEGFDRASIADPLDDVNLLRPHGRGIYLIETLADEAVYEREGRRVRMVFRNPPEPAKTNDE